MAEEQERRESLVDRANDLYSAYNRIRQIQGLIKKVQLAQKAAALLATSEVWGPILIGIGLVVLFTVIITTITGGRATAGENPPSQTTPPVSIGSLNIFGGTAEDQNLMNGFYQQTSVYPKYQSLLSDNGPVNIYFAIDPGLTKRDPRLCGGSVEGAKITFYNFPTSSCTVSGKRYMFLHESGHVIANRNRDLYNSFALAYAELKDKDFSCYSRAGFLRTYFEEFGAGENSRLDATIDESFAEAIAVSVLRSWSSDYGKFDDFPKECPATFNWIGANVLGL